MNGNMKAIKEGSDGIVSGSASIKCDENGQLDISKRSRSIIYISSYDADLTMDGTAQAVTLATGATKIIVQNRGASTEAIRVAFGTSAANAQANLNISAGAATTGHWIGAAADGYESKQELGIPANATHYAVANAVALDTQIVSISQGV